MKALFAIMMTFGLRVPVQAQTQCNTLPLENAADGPASLCGIRGSGKQRRARRDGGETNPARLPYVIGNRWLRQGFIHRYLFWRGAGTGTRNQPCLREARCGEDDLRDYSLRFELHQGLSIRWADDFVACDRRLADRETVTPGTEEAIAWKWYRR